MRGKRGYQYDALSRLTHAGNEQFIYDATGNLLDVSGLDPVGYGNPAGDRLHTLRTGRQQYMHYGHDAYGRRTESAENDNVMTRYGYDAVHQLREVVQANGVKARYDYDALGRRVAKHVTNAKGRTVTTLFVWDGDWLVQEITNGKAITYVKHPDHAGPLAKIENGKTYHYVTDHIGTPQELHDSNGKIVWAADYSAYGLVRKLLADEVSNPIRFAGQYHDAETGLRYNGFRYYDAVAGRYLTQDPIGLRGGINQYAYVSGNPLQRTDMLGLDDSMCQLDASLCNLSSAYVGHTDSDQLSGQAGGMVVGGVGVGAYAGVAVSTDGQLCEVNNICFIIGPMAGAFIGAQLSGTTGAVVPGSSSVTYSGVGAAVVGAGGRAELSTDNHGTLGVSGGPSLGGGLGGALQICYQMVSTMCHKFGKNQKKH
jgi:type VI secretion system secreted protein VgrG